MPIRMAKLTRSKNGDFVSRKGIPADVREEYTRLRRSDAKAPLRITRAGGTPTAPKVWEELFKRTASTSPSAARVAWAEWSAEIDTRVATLRAAAKGEGRPLTQLNAQALAGKWYSWFLRQHENETRLASHWAELRDYVVWDVIGREAPDGYDTHADPHWEWAKDPEVRDTVRPVIAEITCVASFLSSEGIPLDASAYKLFTNAVSDLLFGAFGVLEKRPNGDFTPDETPKQFPVFDRGAAKRTEGLSCWALFEAWVKSAKRAGSSVRRARGVFLELEAKFLQTSAAAITPRDAKIWIDSLVTEERSAFTVANVWLSASKAVFNWAVEQQLITANPFAIVKVTKQKRTRERSGKTFTKEEVCRGLVEAGTWGEFEPVPEGGGTAHRPVVLSGSCRDGEVGLRQQQDLDPPVPNDFRPYPDVTVEQLRLAATTAAQMEQIVATRQGSNRWRFNRVLALYAQTRTEQEILERIHQCTRCMDGFVTTAPGQGKREFKSRTELFIGPHHHDMMGEIYDVRSSVEHLHEDRYLDPLTRATQIDLTKKEAVMEHVVRTTLARIVLNDHLWSHFTSKGTLAAFWARPAAERRDIWGEPIDPLEAVGEFDERFLRQAQLR